jgi:hypothetical protein
MQFRRVASALSFLLLSVLVGGQALAQTEACPATCEDGCVGGNGIDHDGDCCCDTADNCPRVYNPSQADTYGDPKRGDACEGDRIIYVAQEGTFPSPCQHDYSTIQEAVDSALPLADVVYRVSICTGATDYHETVTIGAAATGSIFRFLGNPITGPVVIDGGTGPAFDIQEGSDHRAHVIHGLRIQGTEGIHAAADTRIEECQFKNISDTAVVLVGKEHRLTQVVMDSTVHNGVVVEPDTVLDFSQGSLVGLSGTPVATSGSSVTIDSTLIAGATGGPGVLVQDPASTLGLRYVTVADGAFTGIDNTAGGTVTVENSIVYGNLGGDLVNVPCESLTWSDTGSPSCAGINDNIATNPRFAGMGDYHLLSASPLLDYGPSPALFTGKPCQDLDLGLRLLDYDGDGIATSDPGPYEKPNRAKSGPGEPPSVEFLDKVTFSWAPSEFPADEYHDYRGLLSELSYAYFGACVDDLDPDRTDTLFVDATLPPVNDGFFYLVTGEDSTGEDTLGFAECAERSSFFDCP